MRPLLYPTGLRRSRAVQGQDHEQEQLIASLVLLLRDDPLQRVAAGESNSRKKHLQVPEGPDHHHQCVHGGLRADYPRSIREGIGMDDQRQKR